MQIRTCIEIEADPSKVWQVLMNTPEYEEWNPFILELNGVIELDSKLKIKLKSGKRSMTIKPRVTHLNENKKFAWKGSLGVPRIFDGYHIFELEETEKGTELIHREEFKGILVWPIMKIIKEQTRNNFLEMNKALKKEAEALVN